MSHTAPTKPHGYCQWYNSCTRLATHKAYHPVLLKEVPVCEKCYDVSVGFIDWKPKEEQQS